MDPPAALTPAVIAEHGLRREYELILSTWAGR
jgi:hypothetical protein